MYWQPARGLLATIVMLVGVAATQRESSRPSFRVPKSVRHLGPTLLAFFVMSSLPALGETPTAAGTLEVLERLGKALEKETGLAPETKQALQALVSALRAERTMESDTRFPVSPQLPRTGKAEPASAEATLAPGIATPEEKPWEEIFKRLTVSGDFRLRSESNVSLVNNPSRHRQRVRFRIGANYKLTDEIVFGGRLITGNPADPQSPHQTLGNVFHSFTVSLDRAFMTYRPAWLRGSSLTTGKFGHPFTRNPIYGELVWDADVQPEGIVAGYTVSERGRLESFNLRTGWYALLEQSRANEGFVSAFQASSRVRLAEHVKANLAAGYYYYSDVTPSGSRTILSENGGNATLDRDGDGTPDDFVSRFGILNPIVGLTYDGWKEPLTLSAEYILNTRAQVEQDQGWAVGASLGKTRKRGDWRLYYQWQVVEQDAVFSPVSQDDFLFGTNHRSHVFGVNYQLVDKIGLHLWALASELDATSPGASPNSDENQWRLRLDMNIRF